jgi:hypothetical protein
VVLSLTNFWNFRIIIIIFFFNFFHFQNILIAKRYFIITFITSFDQGISISGAVTANSVVCDNVDTVDISDFKADYDQKVDQDVRTTANPSFNNLTVNDLTVNGTSTTVNSTTVAVSDSIMKLAKDNITDSLDSGWYAPYNDGSAMYAGLVRDATDSRFKFFTSSTEPTTTADVSVLADVECKDLSCAVVTTTGLINGRDLAADGTAQDTHIADATIHRVINDAGADATELWSAAKITTELALKSDVGHGHASTEITYSNATSGLAATDTQGAIDEVEARVDTLEAKTANDFVLTSVNSATYNILQNDYVIAVDYSVTGACTLTLPQISSLTTTGQKKMVIVKDTGLNCSVNNVTIACSGADTIDGSASFTLSGDGNSVQLMSTGSNWFIL